ncbi:hypothetical protein [Streptomyces sp. NPDC060205]|uniref:hypothetical protein n=1 Tax=Streptomyces sp. NPDC060205 TaxID=3347072 RepID=UPI00364BF2A7
MRKAKGRWRTVAAAAAAVTVLVMPSGPPVDRAPRAAPVAAVPELVRVPSGPTPDNSEPRKSRRAQCPAGHRVVGGGGWAFDHGHGVVALTGAEPGRDLLLQRDYFRATASEPSTGFTAGWWLEAYALCAPAASLPGYQQVSAFSSAIGFATARVRCPAGRRVIGTGAAAFPELHAGLQLFRSTGARDAAMATVHARGDHPGMIRVRVLGICTTNPAVVAATVRNLDNAAAACPSGTRVHGVGGGGGPADSGKSFLQEVYPPAQLDRASTSMTAAPNGGMVSQAICAG